MTWVIEPCHAEKHYKQVDSEGNALASYSWDLSLNLSQDTDYPVVFLSPSGQILSSISIRPWPLSFEIPSNSSYSSYHLMQFIIDLFYILGLS
jgi:hypothetical protein